MARALELGLDAFRKRAWGKAFSHLAAADRESSLAPGDLLIFAQAAMLTGREAEGAELLSRAHHAFLNGGDTQLAARSAFWLGFSLLINGEIAKAGGWLSRAGRLLDGQPDCVERGYLLLSEGYRSFSSGDTVTAHGKFVQAAAIAERFGDKDLAALALQGQGRSLIRQGEIARGVALLDEAMVSVTAGEVSPLNAGAVYCSVLDACGETFDLQRAQEWTSALEKWCASQPELVPYRGHCLVRRAEILQLHGAWSDALNQARRACECLSKPSVKPAVGAAIYCLAELHRLRGNFVEAEKEYRRASQWDRTSQTGFALLRLAQDQVESAITAIRRVVSEVKSGANRAKILDAYVEIAIAANDMETAREAADELGQIARKHGAPFLLALSERADGAVLLAEEDAGRAVQALRKSWMIWCELEAPYEAARTRVLIARACRKLGDDDASNLELAAARDVFQQLGAATDLAGINSALLKKTVGSSGPLTAREVEVIRLLAAGLTNRDMADKLGLSEKTVARHVSNIFTKLDLSSRTAAAAYAYKHKLVV
jgi:ATP/maltotriose-dependent transcriptional regulator MalT